MKVVSVVGNRPQFIKAAPLSARFARCRDHVLVHTGQHYDAELSQVFFDELGLPPPDHEIAAGSGSHAEQTAAHARSASSRCCAGERPDLVLVYGDTNSTLAGALVAAKLRAAPRPRRVGPALVRPGDAGGDQPGRRRRPLRPALLPQPDGGREPGRRGHHATACTWSAT